MGQIKCASCHDWELPEAVKLVNSPPSIVHGIKSRPAEQLQRYAKVSNRRSAPSDLVYNTHRSRLTDIGARSHLIFLGVNLRMVRLRLPRASNQEV